MYTMKRHNGHNTRITKFTMILMIKRLTEGDLVNTESRFFLPVARATRIPASRDSRIATDSVTAIRARALSIVLKAVDH
jgi:hypothetical protein